MLASVSIVDIVNPEEAVDVVAVALPPITIPPEADAVVDDPMVAVLDPLITMPPDAVAVTALLPLETTPKAYPVIAIFPVAEAEVPEEARTAIVDPLMTILPVADAVTPIAVDGVASPDSTMLPVAAGLTVVAPEPQGNGNVTGKFNGQQVVDDVALPLITIPPDALAVCERPATTADASPVTTIFPALDVACWLSAAITDPVIDIPPVAVGLSTRPCADPVADPPITIPPLAEAVVNILVDALPDTAILPVAVALATCDTLAVADPLRPMLPWA